MKFRNHDPIARQQSLSQSAWDSQLNQKCPYTNTVAAAAGGARGRARAGEGAQAERGSQAGADVGRLVVVLMKIYCKSIRAKSKAKQSKALFVVLFTISVRNKYIRASPPAQGSDSIHPQKPR